jgi:2-desacetyl-2-hydroxyethyl bacteriochlorophyllide A dehydrogenase
MKAMVFRGVNKPLQLESVPDPVPGVEEVVVKVGRCGICGTDLHRTEQNLITFKEGAILGHEFAGEVVALGKNVTGLKVGDRVTALPYLGCNRCEYCIRGMPNFCSQMRNVGTEKHSGAYAEFVTTGAPFTIKLPDGLTLEDGALIEPLAVGLRGVLRGQVKPGQKVLVLGAGPIGLAVAYWAKRAGAAKVAVQASSTRRAIVAAAMGADVFVTPEAGSTAAASAVRALGAAPDVVFECVGSPGLVDQALASVRVHGVVVILGVCAQMDQWFPVAGLVKEVDVRFSMVYHVNEYHVALDALERGDVTPRSMVTDTVGLEQMADAFEGLRHHSNQCKVMVAPHGFNPS